MTHTEEQQTLPPTGMPDEWLSELAQFDPRSHQYRQLAGTLGELAAAEGIVDFAITGPNREKTAHLAPEGYASVEILPTRARIPRQQFDGIIHSIQGAPEVIETEVTELVTDANVTVRLCDLRPFMSNQVRKGGPAQPSEIAKLDALVLRDLKIRAETGMPRNTVTGVSKVCYTKARSNKIRAYWMPVKVSDDPTAPITFARIADCGNSERAESDVYREVFGRTF